MIYDTLHQIIALGSEVREMSEKEFQCSNKCLFSCF